MKESRTVMPEYRLISNGYVDASLSDQELTSLFKNLRYLRKDSYNDFELVIKGHVAEETLRDVRRLVGSSFEEWLKLNFDGGRGPLASLARDIVHYLNGKQHYSTVVSAVRIAEQTMMATAKTRQATYIPVRRSGTGEPFLKDGYTIQDYDLYRLAAGVGPAVLGRLFLLLGGDAYYA